jgi:hypothetical protein
MQCVVIDSVDVIAVVDRVKPNILTVKLNQDYIRTCTWPQASSLSKETDDKCRVSSTDS